MTKITFLKCPSNHSLDFGHRQHSDAIMPINAAIAATTTATAKCNGSALCTSTPLLHTIDNPDIN